MSREKKAGSGRWTSGLQNIWLSVIAILLSLVITSIIMAASGNNLAEAYSALFKGAFGSRNAIANTLAKTVPLIFVGMACAFSNKGGIFNIGCEGQLYSGALAAAVAAIFLQGAPRILVIPAAFVAGMAAGMLVGGLNGFLKAKLQINEVLVAIMLNYIMRYLTSYFVHGPLKDPEASVAQTVAMDDTYMLTKLVPKTQLTTALLLALVIAVLLHFFFLKTRTGFNIRAVGENRLAAQASGIAMSSTVVLTMAVSGALAALTGVTEVLGKTGKFVDGFSPGYGFTGIAVAVLGRNNPAGVLLSALLFGIMESGAMKMSYVAGVSTSMIKVMQGLVILFVATPNLVSFLRRRKGERKGE